MNETGAAALPDWPRALGAPVAAARLRAEPADFRVVEELGFTPSDDGEHDFLLVEKTRQTTTRVASELARHAGVHKRTVGFSGMKDRDAVTQQWFSVQRPVRVVPDWGAFSMPGVAILEATRHSRKLKRGSHRRNRFRLVLRELADDQTTLETRLRWLAEHGMPNYFGEQRFGWRGGNIELAQSFFAGRRLPREKRSIGLSAARSLIFNDVLAERIADGTWNTLQNGDLAGLEGTGSVFAVDEVDNELRVRAEELDVHPTGPLWGAGPVATGAGVARLEDRVACARSELRAGLEQHTKAARRALRCKIHDLEWRFSAQTLRLEFALGRGSFATALLRELVSYEL